MHSLKVFNIPQGGRATRGRPIVNLLRLSSGEKITATLPVREFKEDCYIVMATAKGIIKKTELGAFAHIRAGGIAAITLDERDSLIGASLTDGRMDILLGTKKGMSIRFREDEVRGMGRQARGVRGITLAADDVVVGMEECDEGKTILTVTEKGYGKRTKLSEYRVQSRGGRGIINIKVTDKNGHVVGIAQVKDEDEIMLITDKGRIIRISMKDVPIVGRNTQGVKLMDVDTEEVVTGIAHLAEEEE